MRKRTFSLIVVSCLTVAAAGAGAQSAPRQTTWTLDRLDTIDGRVRTLAGGDELGIDEAAERVHDVGRCQLVTVVEFHALFQIHDVGQLVGLLEPLRQPRDDRLPVAPGAGDSVDEDERRAFARVAKAHPVAVQLDLVDVEGVAAAGYVK